LKINKNIILIIINIFFLQCSKNILIINNNSLNAYGDISTLNLLTWNVEQFPKNNLTLEYLNHAIDAMAVDVIALQEIKSLTKLNELTTELGEEWISFRDVGSSNYALAYLINTNEIIDITDPFSLPYNTLVCKDYMLEIDNHPCQNPSITDCNNACSNEGVSVSGNFDDCSNIRDCTYTDFDDNGISDNDTCLDLYNNHCPGFKAGIDGTEACDELDAPFNSSEGLDIVSGINDCYDVAYNFASRMPYVLEFTYKNQIFYIINVHFKCCNSYGNEKFRRYEASSYLANYINNNYPNDHVIIMGDFNGNIDETVNIEQVNYNVFEPFLGSSYMFADENIHLGDSELWSYPTYPSHIDHVVITNEILNSLLIEYNTNTVLVEDMYNGGFTEYNEYISDHRPILINLNLETD